MSIRNEPKKRNIKLLLIDSHIVLREGLRILLEQQADFTVVGEACSGDAGLAFLADNEVDVVVLDMRIPGTPVFEVIASIRRLHPHTHVLMFTGYALDTQVRDALEAGATGYLPKDAPQDDLVRAVREIAAGRAWLHPQAQEQMLAWVRTTSSLIDRLLGRESSR